MNSPRTTLYRDKQNAKLMGVCSGIADYTGINAFWVRLAFLLLLLLYSIRKRWRLLAKLGKPMSVASGKR